jgi:serine/threonine protein kinase
MNILSASEDIADKAELQRIGLLGEQDISQAILEVSLFVTEDRNVNQFLLGGDFLDETGRPRHRKVISLDVPAMVEKNPFLKKLCIKTVPVDTRFEREIKMQIDIQTAFDQAPTREFSVPRIVQMINVPDKKLLGVVMERLPKGDHDGSLQSLVESAKRNGISVRLSHDISGDIASSYRALHEVGFLHNDVNEGNIYLTGVKYRDYNLPKEKGKPRPPQLRIFFSANIVLTDFEKTVPLVPGSFSNADAIGEDAAAEAMIDDITLSIGGGASLEEIIEANDEYFEERRAA